MYLRTSSYSAIVELPEEKVLKEENKKLVETATALTADLVAATEARARGHSSDLLLLVFQKCDFSEFNAPLDTQKPGKNIEI